MQKTLVFNYLSLLTYCILRQVSFALFLRCLKLIDYNKSQGLLTNNVISLTKHVTLFKPEVFFNLKKFIYV